MRNSKPVKTTARLKGLIAAFLAAIMIHAATLAWGNTAIGLWSDANNWSSKQTPASGDNAIAPNGGAYPATGKFAMLPIHDLLCHYRSRTRGRFDRNFQNDFCVSSNGDIPLNSSGGTVARHDASQAVMFFCAATARGPPWSGDQSLNFCKAADGMERRFAYGLFSASRLKTGAPQRRCPTLCRDCTLYLIDNALNRSARSFSTAFSTASLLSDFQFHNSKPLQNQLAKDVVSSLWPESWGYSGESVEAQPRRYMFCIGLNSSSVFNMARHSVNSSVFSRVDALLVAAISQSNATQPFSSRS